MALDMEQKPGPSRDPSNAGVVLRGLDAVEYSHRAMPTDFGSYCRVGWIGTKSQLDSHAPRQPGWPEEATGVRFLKDEVWGFRCLAGFPPRAANLTSSEVKDPDDAFVSVVITFSKLNFGNMEPPQLDSIFGSDVQLSIATAVSPSSP